MNITANITENLTNATQQVISQASSFTGPDWWQSIVTSQAFISLIDFIGKPLYYAWFGENVTLGCVLFFVVGYILGGLIIKRFEGAVLKYYMTMIGIFIIWEILSRMFIGDKTIMQSVWGAVFFISGLVGANFNIGIGILLLAIIIGLGTGAWRKVF